MLKYRLESKNDERMIYIYYPEGYLSPGRVVFYSDGTKDAIEDSDDDVKGYYRGHALHGIPIGREHGTVAWC